jgi:dipeptidyl aminopeptidase/acylaminoacyl peptidase
MLNYLDVGRTIQLYAVPEGQYEWRELTLRTGYAGIRYQFGTNPEFGFRVHAGKITYAGELIVRATSLWRVNFHISNRTLPVIDWLETAHPALYRDYQLTFSGHYPDPFPQFYRAERAASATSAADLNEGRTAPKPAHLPLTPKTLWAPGHVEDIALSPNGELLAESNWIREGVWALRLIDLKAGVEQILGTSAFAYDELEWKDDSTLFASGTLGTGVSRRTVHLIGGAQDGKRRVQSQNLPLTGDIVDLLPEQPGVVLFERFDNRDNLVVHRLDVSSPAAILRQQHLKSKDRLNTAVPQDRGWYADGHGELRAVVAKRDDEYVLLHGRGATFTEVLNLGDQDGFQPLRLSYEGDLIYGLSDEGREQRDLVAFDPVAKTVTRTIFSKPGVDVVAVLLDERRTPIAARYYQGGRLATEYFDQRDRAVSQQLQQAFPGRTVSVVERSRDGRQMVLWVDSSDHPPALYHMDLDALRASLISETRPDLSNVTFAPAHVLSVKGSGGLPIEAYLTLPPATGKRPLVVMPHGGPIGVADRLHFNQDVQFLASLGYAVLQVNFRGSDGYGKAFREAGHRNQGRLIEDDIDAAIKVALAGYPLDGDRMCALGASYGGYSAMVSTIRWPGRFRCVVSMSGVSDRALFFTASDSGRDAKVRKQMERIIGDPNTDLAEMQATSPLYHFRDLKVPLMLVHGREDFRVDFEHTRRLVRMLNLAGNSPVVMAFADEGHGLDEIANIETAWNGIAGFLAEHLGPVLPVAEGTNGAAAAGAVPATAAPPAEVAP